jgi:cytochrome oxidase Cu insertion factor (SCO1/SenC/PrrC family)
MKSKGVAIAVLVLAILVVIVGFSFFGKDTSSHSSRNSKTPVTATQASETSESWTNFPLTNVNTGEAFTISELNTKPILLETFAVWCPTCTSQQREIKKLHDEIGEEVVSISLDTDPNEDETKILEHTQSNGFDWHYAVAPAELSEALIDEFGIGIVNAPSAPVILICEDGSFRKLGSGIKKVQELKNELATCPN